MLLSSTILCGLRPLRRASLVLGAACMAGCWGYVTVEPGAHLAPSEARLRVSRDRAAVLGALVGPGDTVDGRIVAWTQDTVLLARSAPAARARGDGSGGAASAHLRIPARDVLAVSLKRLDRRKTAIAVIGTAAATALVLNALFAGSGGTTDGGGVPRPDVDLLPLVR